MILRRTAWVVLGAMLFIAPAVFAQDEFKEFLSKEDLFSTNFPGDPVVTTITWETEYGAKIPGHVYTVTRPGPRTYSVTVVDYGPVQKIHTDEAKSCFPGDERCSGDTSFPGAGYWKNDVRGAMIYAVAKYLKNRDNEVTNYAWSFLGTQAVENNELQLVNNKNKSRTFVNVFMHHNRLYIMEETTPVNAPPPGLFVQSMTLKESDGTIARHYGVYFNGPTIDPAEAKTCSTNIFGDRNRGGAGGPIPAGLPDPNRGNGNAPNAGRGGGAGPSGDAAAFSALFAPCRTLPAGVRFKQGPDFSIDDTSDVPGAAPAAPPAPAVPRRNQ